MSQDLQYQAACSELLISFANLIDSRQYGPLAELFTEDGEIWGTDGLTRGRAAIREVLQRRPESRFTRHLVTNIQINGTSDSQAVGQSYVLFFLADSAGKSAPFNLVQPEAVAQWSSVFQQTPAGWRIARHEISFAFRAAAQKG